MPPAQPIIDWMNVLHMLLSARGHRLIKFFCAYHILRLIHRVTCLSLSRWRPIRACPSEPCPAWPIRAMPCHACPAMPYGADPC